MGASHFRETSSLAKWFIGVPVSFLGLSVPEGGLGRDRFRGSHFTAYAALSQLGAPALVGAWAENVRSSQGALRAWFIFGRYLLRQLE